MFDTVNNKKTEFEIFTDVFNDFVVKNEWLFSKSAASFRGIEDYILHFDRLAGQLQFFKFYKRYNLELLTDIFTEKNLLGTKAYILQNGQTQYYSIFQVSKDEHYIVDYVFDIKKEKMTTMITLYTSNPADYPRRLKEFDKHLVKDDSNKAVGFGM